jgi:hypothetical protein
MFMCFFFDLYVAFPPHKPVKLPHKPIGFWDFLLFLTKIMDGMKLKDHWMSTRTDGRSLFLYSPFFFEKAGDKKQCSVMFI